MQIDAVQDQIIDEMQAMRTWLDKYEYLVAQGRGLEPLAEDLKTDANAISGCQSSVWLNAVARDGSIHYQADSDTQITKGMIALLIRVLDHRDPRQIIDTDLYFIEKTGLASHLSPARANGVMAILKQMKRHAEECLQAGRGRPSDT